MFLQKTQTQHIKFVGSELWSKFSELKKDDRMMYSDKTKKASKQGRSAKVISSLL